METSHILKSNIGFASAFRERQVKEGPKKSSNFDPCSVQTHNLRKNYPSTYLSCMNSPSSTEKLSVYGASQVERW